MAQTKELRKWHCLDVKDNLGRPIRGIFYRDYGKDGRSYRLKEMCKGETHIDFLGMMSLEDVLKIRTRLQENRQQGIEPLTYKGMQEIEQQQAQVAALEKDKEEKAQIAKAHREKNSTIEKYYQETYWPERQRRRGNANQNRTVDGHFRNWIRPAVGHIPFAEFTYKDIDRLIQAIRDKGKTETTVKHIVDTLANIWNRAMADEIISKPFPRKKAESVIVDNEKTCFLTEDEADLLLETLKTWEPKTSLIKPGTLHDYCVLSLHTGLRCSEIQFLTWQNVAAGKVVRTKNKKARTVHFDVPEIADMLNERRKMFPDAAPQDFVFPEQCGNVAISKEFARVVEQLGFNNAPHRIGDPREKIDFHAMRHTFASWLAMKETPLYDIMILLGHSSLKMVQRYAALSPAYTKKAVMALSRKKEAAILADETKRFIERHEADERVVQ